RSRHRACVGKAASIFLCGKALPLPATCHGNPRGWKAVETTGFQMGRSKVTHLKSAANSSHSCILTLHGEAAENIPNGRLCIPRFVVAEVEVVAAAPVGAEHWKSAS